jgi:hypothetical protein
MAAMPKRRRMREALARRASSVIGAAARPIDYICAWVASGGQIAHLAQELEVELGESVSRSILSTLAHRLAPDASERISAARLEGTLYLAKRAWPKLSVAPPTEATVRVARMRRTLDFPIAVPGAHGEAQKAHSARSAVAS